jgi:hypothetical protein
LLGLARAQVKAGNDKDATKIYAQFVEQWKSADADLPELREAQDYLKRSTK